MRKPLEPSKRIELRAADVIAPDPCAPEKGLLAAVIERAIADVLASPYMVEGWSRHEAYVWLMSSETEPFSFCWMCEHLGLDAPTIQRELRRRKDQQITFIRPWNMGNRRKIIKHNPWSFEPIRRGITRL